MTEQEIIKAWKENQFVVFAGMSPECQSWAEKEGKNSNFSCLGERKWTELFRESKNNLYTDYIVYRLRSDYPEEPEAIELDTMGEFSCPH